MKKQRVESAPAKGAWGTKLGFYLAAIGSAFGLGNLWRFPYVVAENGGGAFVLLYVFLVFIIGLPLLVGELLLGKTLRSSIIPAVRTLLRDSGEPSSAADRLWSKFLPYIGPLAIGICVMVLAYYAVISGWVLHFFTQFVASFFAEEGFQAHRSLNALLENGWLQILLASVHFLIITIIVAKDVEEGIERWVGYMMPVFVILLAVLAAKSISLASAPEALRFLLYPDFSKLRVASLSQALGHLFFTLSIGFGTMVTFGSYFKDSAYIPIAGFRVATLDSVISLFAGVLVFPLVLAIAAQASGPNLLFQTVPVLLGEIPWGQWYGVGFFLCLYLAALGASIGLLETIVANLKETLKLPRHQAAWISGTVCFLVAVIPALSSNVLADWKYKDRELLVLLDGALINWLLPVGALIISQVVYYKLREDKKISEFSGGEDGPISERVYGHWKFALKWLAPLIICFALILQVISLFET